MAVKKRKPPNEILVRRLLVRWRRELDTEDPNLDEVTTRSRQALLQTLKDPEKREGIVALLTKRLDEHP